MIMMRAAFRLVLCLVAAAAAMAAVVGDDDGDLRRVVRIMVDSAPKEKEEAAVAGAFPMVDADGRRYACDVSPKRRGGGAASESEAALGAYMKWRASQTGGCATTTTTTTTTTTAAKPSQRSFWSYEVCFGAAATQHGKDGSTVNLGQSVASQPVVLAAEGDVDSIFPDLRTHPDLVLGSSPPFVEDYPGGDDGRVATTYTFCGAVARPQQQQQQQQPQPPPAAHHAPSNGNAASRSGANSFFALQTSSIFRVAEQPERHYHLALITPRACADEALADVALRYDLRTLRGACATRTAHAEWWTYEVCLGTKVAQFHLDEGTKDRTEVFVVGEYASTTSDGALTPGPPRRTEVFDRGDVCDLTKRPRAARVHYECADPDAAADDHHQGDHHMRHQPPMRIVSVTETSTCEYDIVVSLLTVCEAERARREARHRKHLDCDLLPS